MLIYINVASREARSLDRSPCLVETRTDKHTSAGRPSEIDADQLQRADVPL